MTKLFGYLQPALGCIVLVSFIFVAEPSLAWDAGPEDCKYSECPGGALPAETVTETRAAPDFLGIVANCPSGYKNYGATCHRAPKNEREVSILADCPESYTNNGANCGRSAKNPRHPSKAASCPESYKNMGTYCGKGVLPWEIETKPLSSMKCPSGYFKKGAFCYYDCKKKYGQAYTNTGDYCHRPVGTKSMSSMKCPSGYFRKDARCYVDCKKKYGQSYTNTGDYCHQPPHVTGIESMSCSSGLNLGGARCYKSCPAGFRRVAAGACVKDHSLKFRANTHLAIVNRALTILNRSNDPLARSAVSQMTDGDGSCLRKWQEGLWEADDAPYVDDPVNNAQAAGSHFYNGAKKDAFGKRSNVTTYLLLGAEANSKTTYTPSKWKQRQGSESWASDMGKVQFSLGPNARQSADMQTANMNSAWSGEQCYALGMALHYLTDMTQPMHATGFSGVSPPMFLHPVIEYYVPVMFERSGAANPRPWRGEWKNLSPDEVFYEAAVRGANQAPAMMRALKAIDPDLAGGGIQGGAVSQIGANLQGRACAMALPGAGAYSGYCFINDANVDREMASILQEAYQTTASYIYSVFRQTSSGGDAIRSELLSPKRLE